MLRGIATCTHVRTCVPEKMSKFEKKRKKKKRNKTKQNNRNIKQTGNKQWLKKRDRHMSCNFSYFFEILIY